MFIGRDKEMQLLERLAASNRYEGLILYGRRRIGKTRLLREFSKNHKVIFFAAKEKNDKLNLLGFSEAVQLALEGNVYSSFNSWETALKYIGDHAKDERVILIIDEFPFIAEENPTVKSVLQHTIDHSWSEKNIFLILCGSSVSFMQNEVMGYKSPLYGRATAFLELKPFDYLTSAQFFPGYSNIDKLLTYGVLGGVPFYLACFSDKMTLKENIVQRVLSLGSMLHEESQVLLRMEFREPAIYNSILDAIAGGASKMNEIAMGAHIDSSKCSRYLASLQEVMLVKKDIPCGEAETSKKSVYRISDNFYTFWYKFIFNAEDMLDYVSDDSIAEDICQRLPDYMGNIFERICTEYMFRLARDKKLPFMPWKIGKWWGNNSKLRKQDDVDILCLNKDRSKAIFCECKFRNIAFDIKELNDLFAASEIFADINEKYYYVFAKGGFTKEVHEIAEKENVRLIGIDDLFL